MTALLNQIKPAMPKVEYYKLLLEHQSEIFEHILEHGKINTAQELGMSAQAFSTFYPILVAHSILMKGTNDNA